MKVSDKDIRFVIYTAVFALLLMSFLHIIAPALPPEPEKAAADPQVVADISQRITPLSMLKLREKISTGNKPTFVFIYTSWCPHCRHAMPNVISLNEKGILKHAKVLFISLDKDKAKLANYLSEEGYKDTFIPYQFSASESGELVAYMRGKGATFRGAIPYAALFDKHGDLLAETSERGSWDALLDAIHEVNQ